MKFLFCLLIVVTFFSSHAQNTFEEMDAQKLVDTFFEGFHKGDTILMKSVILKGMSTQTVLTDKKGNHRIIEGNVVDLLNAIATRPEDQTWKEKLLSSDIKIDGNLAQVWTPYEFWLNGTFSHCGANAFTLVRTDTSWKIVYLIDSRRKKPCGE